MDKHCLENQICFKLYALSRQLTGQYRPLLESLDITYPQYLVMMVLWKEKTITVKELGNRLYLDSGTLTPLLKRLEQKKFISRKRDSTDERSVIISLLKAGNELQHKAKNVPDVLGKCLSLKEKAYIQLKEQLDVLLSQLTVEEQ
ncbi:MAG TPA: MarR family transcriptional regulator [Bacteroidia bacterium]|jgi:DNA-binding MarR family transcriptional regulator|nr:MarR family transcriptional regulator [Bacteroidia bacterium]HRG54035.1 MarR family transcriptional regulator [Bacteroidia bacterium]